jgi:hypothetical protein
MSLEALLPYLYNFRSYQWPVWEAFSQGVLRFLLIWHRRAVKTTTLAQICARAAIETVGTYYVIAPTFTLGRRIWWGMLIGSIPPEAIASVNENEMQVVLKNGSVIQILRRRPARVVRGTGLRGVFFDEYSVFPSAEAWNTLRPILMEKQGLRVLQLYSIGEKITPASCTRWRSTSRAGSSPASPSTTHAGMRRANRASR